MKANFPTLGYVAENPEIGYLRRLPKLPTPQVLLRTTSSGLPNTLNTWGILTTDLWQIDTPKAKRRQMRKF